MADKPSSLFQVTWATAGISTGSGHKSKGLFIKAEFPQLRSREAEQEGKDLELDRN